MVELTPRTVQQVFAGLIPDEVAEAYEKLLNAGGVPERDAASFFGRNDIAGTLTDLGMATVYVPAPASPPIIEPVDPDLAIQGVLFSKQTEVFRLQEQLTQGHRRAIEAHGMHRVISKHRPDLAEILTDRDEISRMSGALINDARRDFMELDNLNRDVPMSIEWIVKGPASVEGQVTHRIIYDQAVVQDRVGRKVIEKCTAAGKQVRWRPQIFTKLQIADTSTALVALTLTGLGGAMLIRSEPAVCALREYFELLWSGATPVSGPAPDDDALTPAEREILDLLGAGLTQDRIAERLGQHTSTVRRHLNTIYRKLGPGVATPYQAGVAAERKGWAA